MTYGILRWSNVVFAHFRVLTRALEGLVPPGLEIDRFGGGLHAMVSVQALDVVGPAPRSVIATPPLARALSYTQLHLRTYVHGPAGPGIWLLRTHVDRRWPVAARLAGLPYRLDHRLALDVEAGTVRLSAEGLSLEALVAADVSPAIVPSGTLESFVLERYVSYARLPGGTRYAVHIAHAPWRIRPCEVGHAPTLEAFGFADAELTSCHVAEPVEVTVTRIETLREPAAPAHAV